VETDRSPGAPAGRRSYAFLTLPNYSQIALVNAIEPLRMANRVANRRLYDWQIVSLKGDPVMASSGLQMAPTVALADLGKVDILFVCGGIDVRETVSAPLAKALRRRADAGGALGALCTGGYILARAGLLNRYRATIHWENVHALREEFPLVELTAQVFTIDRDRYTCSGGTAPLDLMLNLIERQHGRHISHQVSEQFVVERVRDSQDAQYVPLRAQLGFTHQSLTKVAQLMEENIEKPLSLDAIARRTGLSRRQIERLFQRYLSCVPKRHYMEIRLRRARELLLQTAMPITEITASCGFQSPPHFSRCYRQHFGRPPSAERRRPGSDPAMSYTGK
jgi:transcriptional regulator GlxA family with amidase domain